ncbi:hypothetical protein C8F04DRAFT_1272617 [Mycena alexandri]|uniref:Uncharacterized protein n=1 Tax=Mycena alexandri TaxID=1745969 RepID=A0AAD6S8E3_9AGAR|nr:hypothetical protein C8F04DRAFT_1272617 [Mycena alexandri]
MSQHTSSTSRRLCRPVFYPSPGDEDTVAHDHKKEGRYFVVGNGRCGAGVFTNIMRSNEQTDRYSDYAKRSTKRWTGPGGVEEIWRMYCQELHRGGCPVLHLPDGFNAPTLSTAAMASSPAPARARVLHAARAPTTPPALWGHGQHGGATRAWPPLPRYVPSSVSPSPLHPPAGTPRSPLPPPQYAASPLTSRRAEMEALVAARNLTPFKPSSSASSYATDSDIDLSELLDDDDNVVPVVWWAVEGVLGRTFATYEAAVAAKGASPLTVPGMMSSTDVRALEIFAAGARRYDLPLIRHLRYLLTPSCLVSLDMPKAAGHKNAAGSKPKPKKTKGKPDDDEDAKRRGNQGDYHGTRLDFLQDNLDIYRERSGKKTVTSWWPELFDGWWAKFCWRWPLDFEPGPEDVPDATEDDDLSPEDREAKAKAITDTEVVKNQTGFSYRLHKNGALSKGNPFGKWIKQIQGGDLRRPKRLQDWQVYMQDEEKNRVINTLFREREPTLAKERNTIEYRAQIARELWEDEPEEVKAEFREQAQEEFDDAMAEYEKKCKNKAAPSELDDDERRKLGGGLSRRCSRSLTRSRR